MEVKFDRMQVSYLEQVKGFVDLKQRELEAAQRHAAEARVLLERFLLMLTAVLNVQDRNPQILPDWSGFRVGDPAAPGPVDPDPASRRETG